MQMKHDKGRARSRRLRSHFSSAQSFLSSPFLTSRWHWGERGGNNETAAAEVWWRPWGRSRQTTAFQLVRGEIYTATAASPGRAGWCWWGGGAGLERDAGASVALALGLKQLISASCQRLAGRGRPAGGRALESFCSSASEVSDLRNLVFPLVCQKWSNASSFTPRQVIRCAWVSI